MLSAIHTRSKSATLLNPTGTFPLTPIPLWRVTVPITVVSIYAYRVGGTSVTINARAVTNTTARFLMPGDFTVPAGPPWASAGALAGGGATSLAIGDSLEAMFQSAVGSPGLIAIQINYTEPIT